VLDTYSELATLSVVPLGVSDFNTEPTMRPHTQAEASDVIDAVHDWQAIYLATLGRRIVHAADEYYLLANRPFPDHSVYEDFPMHEDGIGMARTFEREFMGETATPTGVATGFFAWVDGAPPEGYRAPRGGGEISIRPRSNAPVAIITGGYGAQILAPLIETLDRDDIRVLSVENLFFGGNTGVAGLLTGADLIRVLSNEPEGHRYLLPDVCLSQGRFLDGLTPDDLPRQVEILPTDGIALRRALEPK
jgi:NifB/MoaA-like Fe-S oxidoreductase